MPRQWHSPRSSSATVGAFERTPSGPQTFHHLPDLELLQCKEEGWQAWLAHCGILEWMPPATEDEAYIRYLKFHQVTFPAVPEQYWYLFFRDLVLLEQCFVVGDSIGCVERYPYVFSVRDETPIHCKPIVYPPVARDWLRRYM